MTNTSDQPAWHQALAYAVTGHRLDDLGRQPTPDVGALTAELRARQVVLAPAPVPDDLMQGLGAAQFLAALAQLRRALAPAPAAGPVLTDRPLTAEERRLLTDVPPHHGV